MEREREMYWLTRLWRPASLKPEDGLAGWRLREEPGLHFEFKGCLPRGGESLVLPVPSTDWLRPTRIMEGNRIYSKSTHLNINLIRNTSSQKYPE